MSKEAVPAIETPAVSHNLVGQRLGRKGRFTRQRILAATERLLAGPADKPITLSAVAREASLAMTTLYLYFNDLSELLLAVLDPIIASAENSYIALLRNHWPDESLDECCMAFVAGYHEFWVRHTRILHLRNSFADNNDERMGQSRIDAVWPLMELLIRQMEGDPKVVNAPVAAMATVLLTGFERMITVATESRVMSTVERVIAMATDATGSRPRTKNPTSHTEQVLEAQAKLLELGIREGRRISALTA